MTTQPLSRLSALCVLSIGAASLLSPLAQAQTPAPPQAELASVTLPTLASSSSLPDAPEIVTPGSSALASATPESAPLAYFGQQGALSSAPTASKYAMVIQPGQTAPQNTVRTQVLAGVKDSLSPFAAVGWLISAGYAQAINNSPNYGQTGTGFAQRFGASAARATSENLFYEAVLAPALHEDARYYRMGSGHNFVKRLVYAGTRPIITRTNGGHQTLNIASLGGNLGGSYLTKAYYPDLNTSNTEVLKTFGGSVGGSALGYVVYEFLPDVFHRHR